MAVAVGLGVAEGVGVGVGLAGGVGVGVATPPPWRLDFNRHRRAGLKETYCRIGSLWRLVGIKTETVHCAPANRIRVLIRRKRFRAPGDRACVLGNIPRRAAESSISLCAIMRPARMLRRRVKSDVADINSSVPEAR